MTAATIVWLRDDLRLDDHPALTAATERGAPLVVVFVLDDESTEVRPIGAASRWWLHHSLTSLDAALRERGGRLVLRRGPAETVIRELVAEVGADTVHWTRRYGAAREIDARLKAHLRASGVTATSFPGTVLHEPWTIETGQGGPYRVFTPFWRACLQRPIHAPLPEPDFTSTRWATPASDSLESWALLPTRPDWAAGLRATWTPGEAGATERLDAFLAEGLTLYHRRDEPAIDSTSTLSPHLRFGELSPNRIWARLMTDDLSPAALANRAKFQSELGWREFCRHLLFFNTELATQNHKREFDVMPWRDDPASVDAWQRGQTGIPLVDAGMRELWVTGTMHNRVRMVTASLLVKHLLTDWRVGEQWFWDTLVDADEASNPANWQWVAGSGADASPYIRVFNPQLQSEKFDRDGVYVRRWVPELGTPAYPAPIVDLAEGRRDALAAFERMRAQPSQSTTTTTDSTES